ncbi:hypothetical protein K439DRAFT_824158 [Ramaria rubella]|nr:hypothetical protein K439DRAFT_824158 [Ramaria rubella]
MPALRDYLFEVRDHRCNGQGSLAKESPGSTIRRNRPCSHTTTHGRRVLYHNSSCKASRSAGKST